MNITRLEKKLAYTLGLLTAAILVVLPFHALWTTWLGANVGHLDLIRIWKEVLITAMLLPTIWLAYRNPKIWQWLKRSWLVRLIFAYGLLSLGMGLWALNTHQVNRVALIYALIINLRFFGFFLICVVAGSYNRWLLKHWLKLLIWPSIIVILFGLLQRLILPFDFLKHLGYGPKTIPAYQTVDSSIDYRRIQSTLRGANPLGAYLSLVIPAMVLGMRRPFLKYLSLTGAVAVLFFSYSRSAWIGTALALGFLSWQLLAKKIRWHYFAVICLVTAVLVSVGLYFFGSKQAVQDTLLHTSSKSSSSLSSNAQRSAAIRQAAKEVWHEPFGKGPGSAGPASFRNSHPPRIAEDYYLQIGQEVGVLGIAIFIAINILVAAQLWKIKEQSLAAVLLASLVGISFINLVSHGWTDDTLSLLWWGLAGVALAPAILANRHKRHGRI